MLVTPSWAITTPTYVRVSTLLLISSVDLYWLFLLFRAFNSLVVFPAYIGPVKTITLPGLTLTCPLLSLYYSRHSL